MEEEIRKQILSLYPEHQKVWGPYTRVDGRKSVTFRNTVGTTTSQWARVLLEINLGRRLERGETVDHHDENPFNDDISNLRVLSLGQNSAKAHRAGGKFVRKDVDQFCHICNKPFRSVRQRMTCYSKSCKSELRRNISVERGLVPPVNSLKVSDELKSEITTLVSKGNSLREVARQLSISRYLVRKYRDSEVLQPGGERLLTRGSL